jgi:hypothetical protein
MAMVAMVAMQTMDKRLYILKEVQDETGTW